MGEAPYHCVGVWSMLRATSDNSRRHHSSGRAALCVALSLLVHMALIPALGLLPWGTVDAPPRAPASRDRDLQVRMVREQTQEKKEKSEEERLYLSQPRPEKEWTPDKARIVSQHAEEVEREMIKKGTPGQPAIASVARPRVDAEPTDRRRGLDDVPDPTRTQPRRDDRPEREQPVPREQDAQPQRPKQPLPPEDANQRPDVVLPKAWEETRPDERAEQEAGARQRAGEAGEQQRRGEDGAADEVDPRQLFPSMASAAVTSEAIPGNGGMFKYLRDVPDGDRNMLNRKRTRYWAFFDRVVKQTREQWSPVEEYRRRDPYGNVHGVKDRLTTLRVTLNGDGSVRQLYLARSSGLDFYDDEAIRALKAAAPFPNPPEGLKDDDGQIHFSFRFYFDIQTGTLRWLRPRPIEP